MGYKDLKPKEKVEHIWIYYRFIILGILLGVVMIVWITTTIVINVNKVYALDVTIVGAYVEQTAADKLRDDLQAFFKEKGIKGEVVVDILNTSSTDPNETMAVSAKFMAKTSSNGLDLILSVGDVYQNYAESGLYASLDELFDNGTLKVEEKLKILNTAVDTADEKVYGVDVTFNPLLSGIADPEKGLIMSMCTSSEKKENTIEVLKYFLNKK